LSLAAAIRRKGVIEMDWRDQAACRTEHPELFFPAGTTGSARCQLARAKAVCHRCPVTAACLAWATDTGQRYGVWGGLSEDERHELQRRRTRIAGRAHRVLICAPEQHLIDAVRLAGPGQGA
jgi:WhiB family transcriptional regulator, redox-sensing transcriptional regulator